MTKKIAFLSTVFFIATILLNNNYSHSNGAKPPLQNTGAPALGTAIAENTCAKSGCHSDLGVANSGSGSVEIDFNNGDLNYSPNTTYTIVVKVNKGNESATRYGFELTALNANGIKSGSFSENENTLEIGNMANREYIYHKNSTLNNSNTFTFNWTSPAQNDGVITFYVAGNAANGNNSKTSDRIYTSSKSVNFLSVGVNSVASNLNIVVLPNPASNYLRVSYTLQSPSITNIDLFDISGRFIKNLKSINQIANTYTENFDIKDISNGLYLVVLTSNNTTVSEKVWIKK